VLGSRFPPSMIKEGGYLCHLTCSLIWFEQPVRPARVRAEKRKSEGKPGAMLSQTHSLIGAFPFGQLGG
jgi:hypothetical protein